MLGQQALVTKFERLIDLIPQEREAASAVHIRPQTFGAHLDIVREGDRALHCVLILEGLAATSKVTKSGKRQITAFHFPGDMPDLPNLHIERLDSDVRAVSECTVALVEQSALRELCDHHPRLASALWRETLVDASIYREWVVNVGSRPALHRVAHLLCEVILRMKGNGLADNSACEFRASQSDLAEATGLSLVHVNRMLQELRTMKLIYLADGQLQILDWTGLSSLAGFRSEYLHIRAKPM